MKALPSIAFSGFRGTASEVTARQVRGRTVLSGRAQHPHVKTPGQSFRRASFSFISKQYRTLTDSQRHHDNGGVHYASLRGGRVSVPYATRNSGYSSADRPFAYLALVREPAAQTI